MWVAPDVRVDALDRPATLVLEYAGRRYHGARSQRKRDAVRDRRIRDLGYGIVHITDADLDHPEALRARITAIRTMRLAATSRDVAR